MFKILARGFWEWGFFFGEERAIRRQKAIVNIKIWAGKTAEKGIICMMFLRKNGIYVNFDDIWLTAFLYHHYHCHYKQ